MKKTLFTATLLAASLMAASTVQAAPQEVTMWHYFDQKPEQEMLADMVEEYNSLQDDIHINATFVSRTELMNQYTVGALSGELPDIGQVDSPDMDICRRVLMSSRKWLQQQQMHPMMYTDSQCVQYLQKKEHSRSFHG